ncbi:hypothetical protein MMC17_004155 [Xylographa soralifera]|nr:hypothetical protein [Xylographa soralifera]
MAASASPELNICRQVLSIVQEQASTSKQKQRHVPGMDITIKECYGEIATSVQKFVDIGDIISQVDPIHIGLPWAGIRLVLLLAIQSHTTEVIIYQGLGTIAKLVYVYHIYEHYYLRGSSPVQDVLLEGLRQNLVTLYGSMVLFILQAQLYFRQHSTLRTLTATATTSRLKATLDDIANNEECIQRFERLQLKKDANEQYLATKKFLGFYDDFLEERQRKNILAWISDMDYRGHHKGIHERLLHGTGEWLFQKREYIRWQQSTSSSLLWLRGDVKVEYTKVTIIIDALDECQSQQREKLLRFLIKLIRESNAVLKILVSSRDGTEIADYFGTIGSLHIDASDNEADIREYVDVQIETRLLSGTANHELKAWVKTLLNAKAQGMFRWVELQVESLCDPDDVQYEEDVRRIAKQLPPTLGKTYLETMEVFNNYRGAKRDVIKNALRLLLCSQRTLKVDELLAAVSVGMDGRMSSFKDIEITKMSRSFIVIDEESRTYRFAHLSVREFLEGQPDFSEESTHACIATICLSDQLGPRALLETAGAGTVDGSSNNTPQEQSMSEFGEYASIYWGRHCRKAGHQRTCEKLQKLLSTFLFGSDGDQKPFVKWCKAIPGQLSKYFYYDDALPDTLRVELSHSTDFSFRPLFAICTYGFLEMVGEPVISCKNVLDCFNMVGMNPLEVAAYHDNYEVTKELFTRALGCGPSLEWGQSLLENVVRGGTNTKITQFLLQELQRTPRIEDVIVAAVQNQEHSTEMVRFVISTQSRNFNISELSMEEIARKCRTLEAFQVCLKHFGGKITSIIAKATAENGYLPSDSMKMLLSRDTSFIITEELATYFVMRGQNFVELLFIHHEDFTVSSKLLTEAVSSFRFRDVTMKFLLSKAKSRHVNEAFSVKVAAHRCVEEMMMMIREVCPTLKLTRPVLEAATGNFYVTLPLFLAVTNCPHVSADLVYVALTEGCNDKILEYLLERDSHTENEITEEMLEMAISRKSGHILRFLLRQPRAFPVTTRMLTLALQNPRLRYCDINLLLSHMTKAEPSEDILIAAMSCPYRTASAQYYTTEAAFLTAGKLQVSSDMLQLTAATCDDNVFKFVLERADGHIYITDDMIRTSVCKPQNLQTLLWQTQRVKASEATLLAAAAGGDLSALMALVGTSEMEVNKGKLLTAAASNVRYGEGVLLWLLSSGEVDIPEDAFLSAATNRGQNSEGFHVLRQLLRHSKLYNIKEGLMVASASNDQSGGDLMQLLLSRSSEPIITTNVLIAAAANPLPESHFSVLEVVLEHLRDDHLITKDVLFSAAGNAYFGKENLRLLLARSTFDNVDELMLRAAAISELPEVYKDDRSYQKSRFSRSGLCSRRGANTWPIEEVMEYLLERQTAKCTEEVVKLAAGNRTSGRSLMRLLLSHPKNKVLISPSITSMAASNTNHGDIIMKILIEERLEDIDITPEIILAAEANETRGKAILQRLLGIAAVKGDHNILRMLLEIFRREPHGIRDALFQVVYRGQMRAVEVLFNGGADLHEEIEGIGNVLHVAAFRGQSEIVRFLITQGADVNAPGGLHSSALAASLYQSHQETAKMLIEAGASFENEKPDPIGRTALHRAARTNQVSLVDSLIQTGANIFALDKQKCSALHHAATTGSLDVTKLLIASGISVLQADSFGWTPLHWAARVGGLRHTAGNREIVEALLTAGASKEATDSKGMTPFEIAVSFHNDHLRSTLCMTNKSFELKIGRESTAICDGCDLRIYGDRYKCNACFNFDFCYRCIVDAKQVHDPEHTFVCMLNDDDYSFTHE